MREEWRMTPGRGGYEVSDHGNVRSITRYRRVKTRWGGECIKRMGGRTLKPWKAGAGYFQVALGAGAKNKFYVHRLVLEAFRGVDPERSQGNHISGDKEDNSLGNLEWSTQSENMTHSTHTLLNVGGQFRPKLTPGDKAEIQDLRTSGKRLSEIASMFAVSEATISRTCQRASA